jgi:hypothetical protein
MQLGGRCYGACAWWLDVKLVRVGRSVAEEKKMVLFTQTVFSLLYCISLRFFWL